MTPIYEYLNRSIKIRDNKASFTQDDRFWIEAVTDLTIKGDFEVSVDESSWTGRLSIYKLPKGSKVYLYTSKSPSSLKYIGKFNIGGDIRGLVSKDVEDYIACEFDESFSESDIIDASMLNLKYAGSVDFCFWQMFNECSLLERAPELPATSLSTGCYKAMFNKCTSLKQAPELPAMNLKEACYSCMFRKCTSLKQAPKLPAMNLAVNSYSGMFEGCTSLTTAPKLPAMSLLFSCYAGMFEGCTSLKQAPDLPATALAEYCYSKMFENCTSLTVASDLPATALVSYCYFMMYYNCHSLQQIPNISVGLDILKTSEECTDMFRNTKIKNI